MKAVRKVYKNLPEVIRVPDYLKNRRVEVILLPLDEATHAGLKTREGQIPIDEFLGAWKGEPLVREEQGDYEIRESLE
jgi:hypothetical protein